MTNPHADSDLHRRVDALCREILEEEPGIGKEELHRRATAEFIHLSDLSTRQFYARHPLQVKRAMAREGEARHAEQEMEEKIAASTDEPVTEREKVQEPPEESSTDDLGWVTPPGGGRPYEPAQREMF